MLPEASKVIESSNKHALVVKSPVLLDHQDPSPWLGPTARAPACWESFQVPSTWAEKLKQNIKIKCIFFSYYIFS